MQCGLTCFTFERAHAATAVASTQHILGEGHDLPPVHTPQAPSCSGHTGKSTHSRGDKRHCAKGWATVDCLQEASGNAEHAVQVFDSGDTLDLVMSRTSDTPYLVSAMPS